MITFVCFEKTNTLDIKDVFFGMSSMVLYGICYLANVFIHMENGHVSYFYDWYFFAQGGVLGCFVVFSIMLVITFFISYFLWKRNHIEK